MEYLVDVLMPVYNHEHFIERAIQGVVSQETTFKFRLLIGEDGSKDGSRQIIEKYHKQYPEIIFPFYREKNLGAHENSRLLFNEMRSKYIAICEGDDYWTNPKKLQRQVSFLEAHPDIAMSSHNTHVLLADGTTYLYNRDRKYADGPPEKVYSIENYIIKDFFHASAIVFRREKLKDFPNWFREAFGGDYFLVLLTSMNGGIHYINESMSVYRIHGNSISNYSTREEIAKNFDKHFTKFDEYSNYKYHKVIEGKRFSFRYNFHYYHPNYIKKSWFALTNIAKIIALSPSVISRWGRYKIFIPTPLLRSKVDLFKKNER